MKYLIVDEIIVFYWKMILIIGYTQVLINNPRLFRRRLSAEGAKPKSNNRWKMGSAHVCIYVCMYVWFLQISGDLKHRTSPKWYHTIAT